MAVAVPALTTRRLAVTTYRRCNPRIYYTAHCATRKEQTHVVPKQSARLYTRAGSGHVEHEWWPNSCISKFCISILPSPNPMGEDFNYAEESRTLDPPAVKKDLTA